MLREGTTVIDRPTHAVGRIQHVERVPRTRDLFGHPIPAHRRYVVEFHDGRWANDRRAEDLAPA